MDGSGIKVGVISDGIQGYDDPDRRQYELPSSISYLSGHQNVAGSEGLAMWEIIHDIAPGAALHFASAMIEPKTPEHMAQHITSLRGDGCRVIVDDVGWLDAPWFIDDELSNIIAYEVEQHGITYVSAAGNHATQMWGGMFDEFNDGWHLFDEQGGVAYTDNYIYNIPASKTVHIMLQWADNWEDANDNYNLYLISPSDDTIGSGGRLAQAPGANLHPQEIVEFTNDNNYPWVRFRIRRVSGLNDRELKVLAFAPSQDYELEISIPSTENHIFGHSAAIGCISVAAYPAENQNVLEPYSSRGPTNVYDSAGQTHEQRQTPVITATDNVQTSVPGFIPFAGTSAAAPHIAGIAALYFSKYPNDAPWTFQEMLTKSASTLGSIGQGGIYNDQSGFGKANADATLARRATAKSVTLSQVDEQAQNFGQIGIWNGAWDFVPVPITIQWSESSIGLKADQNFKPSTTQKYHDWNAYGDVVNPNDFGIPGQSATFTAYFKPSSNVTIQAQLIEGGNPGGNVEFRDPWLIDEQYESGWHNRGKDEAIWYTKPSPFTPSTSSNYMGVFLNENPSHNPNYAIYKIRVMQAQNIGGFTSYFKNWIASGANVRYPNNLESSVVFQSAGSTARQRWLGHYDRICHRRKRLGVSFHCLLCW